MIKYLAKFVTLKEHAELLLQGTLFMRPASYYHDLELGQGDLREATIFGDVCIYKNSHLPIYCMYTINDGDIKNGFCEIPERCVKDFYCESGYVVLLDFNRFEEIFPTLQVNGYAFGAATVKYKMKTPEEIHKLFCENTFDNLFYKHPFFSYQKEFRIVIAKEVYKFGKPKIDHIEYSFPSELTADAYMIKISSLSVEGGKYILKVSS